MTNIMKRILIISLALIMTLAFVTESYAADKERDLNVAELLKSINLLETESVYEPQDAVYKADFLVMALKAIGVSHDTVAPPSAQLFFDVPVDNKYAGVIEEAYKRSIVFGSDDGIFGVERALTVNEAFAIGVRTLGLEAMAVQQGGWPVGYQYVAYKLGLGDNISESYTDLLTYDSAVNIIYNIICAKVGMELDGTYVFDSGETILNRDLKVSVAEGIVDADYCTNLYGESSLNTGKISVNGEIFEVPEQYQTGYVGYKVRIYYIQDGSDKHIVYMYKKGNSEITVNAEDMVSYKPGEAEYFEIINDKERKEKLRLAPGVYTLHNHARVIISGKMQLPDYGTFTFIDNDNNDEYDTVILSSFEAMLVSTIDKTNQKIYSKNNTVTPVSLEDYDNVTVENTAGESMELKDIKPDNIALIYSAPDKSRIRVVVSTQTKEITLNSKYEESSRNDTYAVFEDAENNAYKTAPTFSDFSDENELKPGNTYLFAVMPDGTLLAVLSEKSEKYSYGYLVAAAQKSGVSGDVQVKVFGTDNKFTVYDCADKITVADIAAGSESKVSDTDALSRLSAKKRLIRFGLNSDGKINRVEFANEYGGGDGFRTVGSVEGTNTNYDSRYYTARGLIGNKIAVDVDTVAMIVPISTESNIVDEDDETLYTVQKSYFSNEGRYHNAVGYASGNADDLTAEIVLIPYTLATVTRSSPEMLIKGFIEKYDSTTDEWLTHIVGLVNGGEKTYPVSNDFDLTYKATDGTVISLAEGDSVRFATDRYGHISSAVLLYDESDDKAYAHAQESYGAERRTVVGKPYRKYGKYLTLEIDANADGELFPILDDTPVYMYDSSKSKDERLSVISLDDMVTVHDDPSCDSRVMIYMSYTTIRYIVYYK